MKILIVDDEPLVRIGIKSCLEWHKYGMEAVGEATDGLEALQQIRKLHPDVLLLDIKMPNMDGIELMRRLKEEKINCKILILSGFDDLYHVKEAMKLGAVDYLHKPCMNPKDILDALLGIKEQMEKEQPTEKELFFSLSGSERKRRMLKDTFLKELVDGNILVDFELEQKLKEHDVRFKTGNVACMAFSVKNLSEVQKRYSESNANMMQISISNIMSEVLLSENEVDFFSYGKNVYAVVSGFEGVVSKKRVKENVNSLINLTKDAMKQFLNVDIYIGLSDVHTSVKEISSAFEEALKALKYRFYLEDAHVINYSEVKQNSKSDILIHVDSLIEKMKMCLTGNNYAEFKKMLEELFDYIKKDVCLSAEEVKKLSNGLLFLMKEGQASLSEMESIQSCETLTRLREIWDGIIQEKLKESIGIAQYPNCGHLSKKIINFINESYAKDINLNLLSENFNVSPNYISRLFREETGENLFNYLNLVRVEKAKKLLKDSEMKIYEVGFKVGFKSTVHFNIVFNKFTGVSPKQYRDN